jgi:dipeptidyl aminopeptidase/acylaminoacyl peptidase
MSTPEESPYGFWQSPITSDLIVRDAIRLDRIVLEGEETYWTESRPAQQGRYFVVRRSPDGRTEDITPDDTAYNVRTRAHEYGGGAFLVENGTVIFSNYADQRLYRQRPGFAPEPLSSLRVGPAAQKDSACQGTQPTAPRGALRYADGVIDARRNRIVCVQEDHTGPGEAVNRLVSVDLARQGTVRNLVSGNDFYSTPRLNPAGTQLAWLTWHHPDMPWGRTELWVGDVQPDGEIVNAVQMAGGQDESIFQPEWSPDGALYFVSDRESGWWNLYRLLPDGIEPLAPLDAEFGVPQWNFGMSTYAFESERRIVCAYTRDGIWYLAQIDVATKAFQPIPTSYTEISQVRATAGRAVFIGGSPTEARCVVQLDLDTQQTQVLRRSVGGAPEFEALRPYLSEPEPISFPTAGGLTAHGLYYPPHNPDFTPPMGERQPLLVKVHGGPTSAASSTLSLPTQYWTSRGIGVLDVNYGGSTGYGRAYRMRLEGRWGIVDVQDCIYGARYLVERGCVDPNRMAISGGSAGGYTVLCALSPEGAPTFRAGASYFGVSDLEALAKDTHKFESRYLDGLVGPYPAERATYIARSPAHHADRVTVPVIFFQGAEDEVVPPSQTESMVTALRARGVTVAYLLFSGEQHGFRRSENIKRSLDAELYFYAAMLLHSGLRF